MSPIHRRRACVLPVSPDGAVLLLQDHDPARPSARRWVSIGGAVDAGESLISAAIRELYEETGIEMAPGELMDAVHQLVAEYSYDGIEYRADCTYFAVPLAREAEISFDHLEPDEVVFAAGWWLPQDLADHGSFADPGLPDIMRTAIARVRGDS